jgi:hypothetical protein
MALKFWPMSPGFNSLLLLRDEQNSNYGGSVGGHKMHIFTANILHFIQDIEDRCLLLMSSTSFVDLPFQEHRMMEKYNMDQNPCISSLCPK